MTYYFEEKLMGGTVGFTLYNITEDAAKLIKYDLLNEAKRLEKIFNFYDPKSELSILNKNRTKQVSKELLEVIKKAINYAELTSGNYDISLGNAILSRKNMIKDKKIAIQKTKINNNSNCSYKNIQITSNIITFNSKDVLIDLGSIAKGYIADKLANYLKQNGIKSAMIDARGDIIIFGKTKEQVEIQHPRNTDKLIENFTLENEAVATSGDYNQNDGTYENSHILNAQDLISVTVIAKTLTDADALASVIFVTDPKNRDQLISTILTTNKSNIRILIIDKNLNINKYNWIS
ncbi:MAG: FAD:protein FMN transferase [Candidatus Woesearchaeota archaeon]|jgi:thiamine biosynthesis lipoprotein